MSKAGQRNQSGIISQNMTAMSLFLQYLKNRDFSYIQLEPDNSEDFDLFFKGGQRIICESKFRMKKFSYSDLKSLLLNVLSRKSINDGDEILLICKNLDENMIFDIKNIIFLKQITNKFLNKGFTEELLSLFPKLNFWLVNQKFLKKVNYELFSQLINIWIPEKELKRFCNHILQDKINEYSINGKVYSRSDFDNDLKKFKDEVLKRASYLGKKAKLEEKYSFIEETVKANKGIDLSTGDLSALSQWELASFLLNLLKEKGDLNLKQWKSLWELSSISYCAFSIFDIFDKNLSTKENRQYALNYINSHLGNIRNFYRDTYIDTQVLKILSKIIESEESEQFLSQIFNILKTIITYNPSDFFYIKNNHYNPTLIWKQAEVCKLLINIYRKTNSELKEKIFEMIVENFNFTADDGGYNFHAPSEIYEVLKMWLEEDFMSRFPIFLEKTLRQYENLYGKYSRKKNLLFTGWELAGGGISFGGSYHATDRHFVSNVLSPAISRFYCENKAKGWEFIKQSCITKQDKVSREKPDFLNRAVYEIVLSRYLSEDPTNESFEILKEWILSRKGIPHKADLIFQAIAGNKTISDGKKWKLVELTTAEYNAPINPFVEEIVADMAKRDFKLAIEQLIQWSENSEYYDRFMFEMDPVRSIRNIFDKNLKLAITLLKNFLKSDYIKTNKGDRFGAFPLAKLLQDILRNDYSSGLEILRKIEKEPTLSKNQQDIYCFSLFDQQGNDESDDINLLIKIYEDVVDPFLSFFDNDVRKISKRLTSDTSREALVQFATRLATHKRIKEALRIIKVFIDDPDPYLPGKDPNDPDSKYNQHKRIEDGEEPSSIDSVRGWCGWTLMKCAVLNGRDNIKKTFELVKKLAEDENYYVIHMACFALGQLAKIRLTHLPDQKDILFLDNDRKQALLMAKEIEKVAFELFEKLLKCPPKVQKALATSIFNVLTHVRALNQEQALKLIKSLKNYERSSVGEAASLFIYFAEFRKTSFEKWNFTLPGLYDDLAPNLYDEKPFKEILEELTINGSNYLRERLGAQFEFLIRESDQYLEMVIKYFKLLANKFDHNTFHMIYLAISEKIDKGKNYDVWLDLYLLCLKKEEEFYRKNTDNLNKIEDIYWWPSLFNSEILLSIERQAGKEKFIQAIKILLSFPKQLEINENEALINKLLEYKSDKHVKKIIDSLIIRKPTQYHYLKKKL